jgi:hypothetical protein
MAQNDKMKKYFADDETPLPIEAILISEMPRPKYSNRFCESKAARARKYDCFYFYKHISRPLPLMGVKGGDHDEER